MSSMEIKDTELRIQMFLLFIFQENTVSFIAKEY